MDDRDLFFGGPSPSAEEAGRRASPPFPAALREVLGTPPGLTADGAWDAFLDQFSEVLLRTASYTHHGHDASMDAYAFILERLSRDDHRRLRSFPGGDRDDFTRWLVFVARRLCSDFRRQRYGRARPNTPELERKARRNLVDEIWDPKPASELPAGRTTNPEWTLRERERLGALERAVQELEPRDQLLLALRFEDGHSARRIAEIMDFRTPFHVYRRLNRVLRALRTRLEGMGVVDPAP